MAYQMAQTPVTLNDLEGHFSYLTLTYLLTFWKTRHVISLICILELESITWPTTLIDLEGHSSVSELLKC